MDPSIKMQLDVRNNAAALTDYAKELKDWEDEMKQKDKFLQKAPTNQELPPVRSKRPKAPKPIVQKLKKSYSTDYGTWDKYDVDKACKDIEQSTSETESSDDEEAMRKGDELKKRGNEFVTKENWDKAIECYTKAIASFNGDAIYYANRALCYIKKEEWGQADRDCCSALELNINYVKALQRRAVARAAVGRISDALDDLFRVIKLEPNNKQAMQHINELENKLTELHNLKKSMNATKSNPAKSASSASTSKTIVTNSKKSVNFINADIPQSDHMPQEWLTDGGGDGRAIVKPVIKAPHQRSKKPLRRITVEELDPVAVVKRSINTITDARTTDDVKSEKPSEVKEFTETIKVEPTEIPDKKIIPDEFKLKEDKACEDVAKNIVLPFKLEAPKTAMHFYQCWKQLKGNMDGRFEFLKMISGEQFPKLFGTSLDSTILSEIIYILKTKFITNDEPVSGYLQGIKSIPRFSALQLFMSDNDKSALKEIFAHSEKLNELGKNELENLMTMYGIKC